MRRQNTTIKSGITALQRIRVWNIALLLVACVFVVRAFYLQVIRHDYYKQLASKSQLKEYEIQPERGAIVAHDGDALVPIVLNEKRYTLFADPVYVKDPRRSAEAIAAVIGGNVGDYEKLISAKDTRYVILAKKMTKDQKSKIDAAVKKETDDQKNSTKPTYAWKGIGAREALTRTYPQGQLAAQVLGFVNDEGDGKYGVEQALNQQLKGSAGQLKAITDASGVPLVANKDNIIKEPVAGKRTALTIDVSMQKQLEDILKTGLDRAKSTSGSALIIDPNTGAIKAMANYPTYNPAEFYKVDDASVFTNAAVSSPLEIGSTMKPFTAAAALDLGVVNKNTSYYDPSRFTIDGYTITNIEEDGGAGTRTVADILQLSLNTGATWLLMQMGGGQVNKQARERWYNYMTAHYQFGKQTGVEQGYESSGTIPDPNNGFGLDIQYANTAFGQGMTATPLQMGAALSSIINGGTYYRPHVLEGYVGDDGKVKASKLDVISTSVVKASTGQTIRELMEYTFTKNHAVYGMPALRSNYSIGGKTGTAQIAKPNGGYYDDRFNGTFLGFVGGDKIQYVIVTRVNEPKNGGYAGARAAAPIFSDLTSMLIDNFNVTPKSQ
jgi:cell division protein FtsI (penicillin-binding protein 3)